MSRKTVLAIDSSGSMTGMRWAATNFLVHEVIRELGKTPETWGVVWVFGSEHEFREIPAQEIGETFFAGGTDFNQLLVRAGKLANVIRKSEVDLVVFTDGQCPMDHVPWTEQKNLRVTFVGIETSIRDKNFPFEWIDARFDTAFAKELVNNHLKAPFGDIVEEINDLREEVKEIDYRFRLELHDSDSHEAEVRAALQAHADLGEAGAAYSRLEKRAAPQSDAGRELAKIRSVMEQLGEDIKSAFGMPNELEVEDDDGELVARIKETGTECGKAICAIDRIFRKGKKR